MQIVSPVQGERQMTDGFIDELLTRHTNVDRFDSHRALSIGVMIPFSINADQGGHNKMRHL